MPKDRHRRYTENEVSAILRIAMDRGSADAEASGEGMSLDELLEVASEAGFEPDLIRSAAEKLDTEVAPARKLDVIGVRSYTELVRVVDGEVTPENWDEVVAELRSAFSGPTGEASQLGKSSEWYAGSELTGLHASFTPEAGRTKMKVRLTAWAVPLISYIAAALVAGMLILAVMLESEFISSLNLPVGLAYALAITAWLGVLSLVRLSIGSWYRKKTLQMKGALDRVQDLLGLREEQSSSAPVINEDYDEVQIRMGKTE